ncbi:MAG: response regulator [Acidobacteriota bacterium]
MDGNADTQSVLLIVDDDEDFLDFLAMHLSPRYKVVFARDGEEALAKVAEQRPSLVLLDVMMPKLGGWSVCWTLKNHKDYRSIPILFLTAVGPTPSVMSQLSRADDYLLKPFELAALDGKIEALLARGQAAPPASTEPAP